MSLTAGTPMSATEIAARAQKPEKPPPEQMDAEDANQGEELTPGSSKEIEAKPIPAAIEEASEKVIVLLCKDFRPPSSSLDSEAKDNAIEMSEQQKLALMKLTRGESSSSSSSMENVPGSSGNQQIQNVVNVPEGEPSSSSPSLKLVAKMDAITMLPAPEFNYGYMKMDLDQFVQMMWVQKEGIQADGRELMRVDGLDVMKTEGAVRSLVGHFTDCVVLMTAISNDKLGRYQFTFCALYTDLELNREPATGEITALNLYRKSTDVRMRLAGCKDALQEFLDFALMMQQNAREMAWQEKDAKKKDAVVVVVEPIPMEDEPSPSLIAPVLSFDSSPCSSSSDTSSFAYSSSSSFAPFFTLPSTVTRPRLDIHNLKREPIAWAPTVPRIEEVNEAMTKKVPRLVDEKKEVPAEYVAPMEVKKEGAEGSPCIPAKLTAAAVDSNLAEEDEDDEDMDDDSDYSSESDPESGEDDDDEDILDQLPRMTDEEIFSPHQVDLSESLCQYFSLEPGQPVPVKSKEGDDDYFDATRIPIMLEYLIGIKWACVLEYDTVLWARRYFVIEDSTAYEPTLADVVVIGTVLIYRRLNSRRFTIVNVCDIKFPDPFDESIEYITLAIAEQIVHFLLPHTPNHFFEREAWKELINRVGDLRGELEPLNGCDEALTIFDAISARAPNLVGVHHAPQPYAISSDIDKRNKVAAAWGPGAHWWAHDKPSETFGPFKCTGDDGIDCMNYWIHLATQQIAVSSDACGAPLTKVHKNFIGSIICLYRAEIIVTGSVISIRNKATRQWFEAKDAPTSEYIAAQIVFRVLVLEEYPRPHRGTCEPPQPFFVADLKDCCRNCYMHRNEYLPEWMERGYGRSQKELADMARRLNRKGTPVVSDDEDEMIPVGEKKKPAFIEEVPIAPKLTAEAPKEEEVKKTAEKPTVPVRRPMKKKSNRDALRRATMIKIWKRSIRKSPRDKEYPETATEPAQLSITRKGIEVEATTAAMATKERIAAAKEKREQSPNLVEPVIFTKGKFFETGQLVKMYAGKTLTRTSVLDPRYMVKIDVSSDAACERMIKKKKFALRKEARAIERDAIITDDDMTEDEIMEAEERERMARRMHKRRVTSGHTNELDDFFLGGEPFPIPDGYTPDDDELPCGSVKRREEMPEGNPKKPRHEEEMPVFESDEQLALWLHNQECSRVPPRVVAREEEQRKKFEEEMEKAVAFGYNGDGSLKDVRDFLTAIALSLMDEKQTAQSPKSEQTLQFFDNDVGIEEESMDTPTHESRNAQASTRDNEGLLDTPSHCFFIQGNVTALPESSTTTNDKDEKKEEKEEETSSTSSAPIQRSSSMSSSSSSSMRPRLREFSSSTFGMERPLKRKVGGCMLPSPAPPKKPSAFSSTAQPRLTVLPGCEPNSFANAVLPLRFREAVQEERERRKLVTDLLDGDKKFYDDLLGLPNLRITHGTEEESRVIQRWNPEEDALFKEPRLSQAPGLVRRAKEGKARLKEEKRRRKQEKSEEGRKSRREGSLKSASIPVQGKATTVISGALEPSQPAASSSASTDFSSFISSPRGVLWYSNMTSSMQRFGVTFPSKMQDFVGKFKMPVYAPRGGEKMAKEEVPDDDAASMIAEGDIEHRDLDELDREIKQELIDDGYEAVSMPVEVKMEVEEEEEHRDQEVAEVIAIGEESPVLMEFALRTVETPHPPAPEPRRLHRETKQRRVRSPQRLRQLNWL